MRKVLLATTALVTMAAPVMAADMPVKAPPIVPVAVYSWAGCYVGGNIGGARLKRELTDTRFGGEWTRTGDGAFIAGGQVGCNFQNGSFVYGAEWDFDWIGDRDSSGNGVTIAGNTYRGDIDNKFVSTLAARFGIANGQWLFYGKAGVGFVKISDVTITNVTTGGTFVGSNSHSASGPMVGLGFEYGFGNNWSFKTEYDYIRLSDRSFTVVGGPFPALVGDTFHSERGIQQLKLGLNYRFSGGWR